MPKKITVVLGHPDSSSFCGALATAYCAAARAAGHSIQYFSLGDMSFDPTLHHGYHQRQNHEPDLEQLKQAITDSEHLVFVYPIWWGSMPAILKGMFDRLFLPGFAFKYRKNSPLWDRLLSGRSAHCIVTMDTPPWYYRLVYKMPGHNQMKRTILEFCGIKPVKITSFGPIRNASADQRNKWIKKIEGYAKRG
jgi:NAD(P)H dehydrogenase (quinone)